MGKSRARLFLGLLIISIMSLSLVNSAYATSVTVSYTTQDSSIVPALSSLTANATLDGTVYNSATGWSGGGLKLDTINNSYVRVLRHSTTDYASAFTICIWIKFPTTLTAGISLHILGHGAYNTNYWIIFVPSSNLFSLYCGGSGIGESLAVSRNAVIFVAVSYDETTCKWYYQGVSNKNTTTSKNIVADANNLYFGGSSFGANTGVNATYYGVQMYNRVLTPSEILANYNAGASGISATSGLSGWWLFNCGSGTKVYGYNNVSAWTGISKVLTMSETASAVNSSCNFYNMPYENSTHLWNGTYYSKRANASTLSFDFTHYVEVNFTVVPYPLGGIQNRTSGWYLPAYTYNALATPNLGYYFTGWYVDGTNVLWSTNNPTAFQALAPISVYAGFSSGIPTTPLIANVQVSDQTQMWIWMGLIAQIALLLLGYKLHYLFHVIAIGVGIYFFFYNWQSQIVISNSTGVFLQSVQMYPPNFFYALIAGLMVMHGLFLMIRFGDSV